MPEFWNSLSATPVRTRSEYLGWKFAQRGPDDERSGFFVPPLQPGTPPKSDLRSTTWRAAALSAEVRWICCLPSSDVEAAAAVANTSAQTAVTVARIVSARRRLSACPASRACPASAASRPAED